ncbi:Hypothetical predicted protein [Cloeon dipterum]|uniref:Uncharacterized protein n=1 Tax=Cloeon dipterum TaxID=197152 RepID=A0A8S1DRC4_9INSE|nr:Hypothetical predicted protein [Cloeon dipterum]
MKGRVSVIVHSVLFSNFSISTKFKMNRNDEETSVENFVPSLLSLQELAINTILKNIGGYRDLITKKISPPMREVLFKNAKERKKEIGEDQVWAALPYLDPHKTTESFSTKDFLSIFRLQKKCGGFSEACVSMEEFLQYLVEFVPNLQQLGIEDPRTAYPDSERKKFEIIRLQPLATDLLLKMKNLTEVSINDVCINFTEFVRVCRESRNLREYDDWQYPTKIGLTFKKTSNVQPYRGATVRLSNDFLDLIPLNLMKLEIFHWKKVDIQSARSYLLRNLRRLGGTLRTLIIGSLRPEFNITFKHIFDHCHVLETLVLRNSYVTHEDPISSFGQLKRFFWTNMILGNWNGTLALDRIFSAPHLQHVCIRSKIPIDLGDTGSLLSLIRNRLFTPSSRYRWFVCVYSVSLSNFSISTKFKMSRNDEEIDVETECFSTKDFASIDRLMMKSGDFSVASLLKLSMDELLQNLVEFVPNLKQLEIDDSRTNLSKEWFKKLRLQPLSTDLLLKMENLTEVSIKEIDIKFSGFMRVCSESQNLRSIKADHILVDENPINSTRNFLETLPSKFDHQEYDGWPYPTKIEITLMKTSNAKPYRKARVDLSNYFLDQIPLGSTELNIFTWKAVDVQSKRSCLLRNLRRVGGALKTLILGYVMPEFKITFNHIFDHCHVLETLELRDSFVSLDDPIASFGQLKRLHWSTPTSYEVEWNSNIGLDRIFSAPLLEDISILSSTIIDLGDKDSLLIRIRNRMILTKLTKIQIWYYVLRDYPHSDEEEFHELARELRSSGCDVNVSILRQLPNRRIKLQELDDWFQNG